MKLTLNDLVLSREALQRLLHRKMPAKVAFSLARIVRRANVELEDYNKTRMGLFKRLGELSEDGRQWSMNKAEDEKREEFAEEMQSLLDAKIELEISQMPAEDLPDILPMDALALWWIVQDPIEEPIED